MDAGRLRRVQELFHEAADRPEPERARFLEAACGEDQNLLAEVSAMLYEDARADSLLDRGLARAAQRLMDRSRPIASQDGFAPYRLIRVIGEGGVGVVYLAERQDLGSLMAIKILRDAWLSPARRERFTTEQQTLAQLIHPGIARLYDARALPDGTPWFVMEYVDGMPITEYCHRHQCSTEERLRLFRSVCEAVQYAHEHAVIHRDLKPSNILVKEGGSVRLLDFGIAKQLDALDQAVDQTRTQLRLMTPAYAAPEQIRGDRVGVFIDVYALGLILYELLAGNAPFDFSGRTAGEVERMVLEQEPERPSVVLGKRERAWQDLDVLCLTALNKDPARRYRSVEALIRDIDHYLKSEPLEARPDTLRYRAGKFVRRHRRAVTVSALVVTTVVSLVVFFTVQLANARNAAQAAAERALRVQQFMLNLFQGGDKEAGPAEGLRVVTLLDRGVEEARLLKSEPEVQAELYQTLGGIYRTMGDFNKSDSLLRDALEERRSLLGSNHRETAQSTMALGLLRIEQAKLDDAERLARQALEQARSIQPPDPQSVGRATFVLGKVFETEGKYDKAIPLLEQAAKLQSGAPDTAAELAESLSELANSHFYAGHYDISDDVNRRALSIDRKLFGERHPKVADTLVNLGASQTERGKYAEAEHYYRQALDMTERWYGPEHVETSGMLYMLGNVLFREGKYDEGTAELEKALRIRQRVYGPVHPRLANVLNELGLIALKRGDLDQAEARLRRSLTIYQSAYGDHHYLVALGLSNLASVFVERKQYERAERLFRDAIRRYTEALSADHLYTGITRVKLGHALALQRRYQEAERESLDGCKIVMKKGGPSNPSVAAARQDLVAIYDALRQPDKAAAFRIPLKETVATARR